MEQVESKLESCPTPPERRVTVHTRVLHRACQKLGGVAELAAFLGVPPAAVLRWLEGESEPPTKIFLKAVDVVMPAWTADDELLARALTAKQPTPKKNR
jgi:hypothetical protein